MAVLKILKYGDKVLRTKSKEIHKVSSKIQKLIDDMIDTMYAQNGVGLAAPQVGENIRLFIIDVSTDEKVFDPVVFINPKIIKKSGAISSNEGCLSFPDVYTDVRRYSNITVKALDSKGRSFITEAKDGSLLARALQHENDHLDGVLFIDHARNRFETDEALKKKGLNTIDPEFLLEEFGLENENQSAPKQEDKSVQE